MSVRISGVEKGSAAGRAGIKAGQFLHAINGNAIGDVLDYRFYITEKSVRLLVSEEGGQPREIKLRKPEYADPGLIFDSYLMDSERSCMNKCCFCFIDQLPGGMRKSLYFKDDDSRLSFLFGNYITLTNLNEGDIERVIKMRISPVNISVHTMNPALRREMMKNPRAGDSLAYISRLCEAGIKVNAQLVLCPGINDGGELEYSLTQLALLGENLQSVSAVPAGLTKFRAGLASLRLFTKQEAKSVIETLERHAKTMTEKYGSPVFYASDEFYLTAALPMPDYAYYGDFPQLENGVGMSVLLEREFTGALADMPAAAASRRVTIATGTAAFPLIKKLSTMAENKFPGLRVQVIAVSNHFFGEDITVAGLITGGDIIAQLKGKALGDCLLFPSSMLRFEGDLFLDDITPADVEAALGIPAYPVPNDGFALLSAIVQGETF